MFHEDMLFNPINLTDLSTESEDYATAADVLRRYADYAAHKAEAVACRKRGELPAALR